MKKRREKNNMIFGLTNVKRCLLAALVSAAVFPALLLLALFDSEFAAPYMIPFAFFSIGSAAFALLFHQVAKNKIRQYYDAVIWLYLIAFHLFFIYIAQENILFYYTVVLMSAYIVLMPLESYAVMILGELVCFAALIVKSGVRELSVGQLLFLAGVHLFAFALSRDFYNTKKNCAIEERKLRREMQESERDPLTGLMNRRGMNRRVDELWQTSLKRKEMVAAFVIDIDLFKSYNDRFGHLQGDECIRRVAHSIADTVKNCGLAARIGGEEFMVFVCGESAREIYSLAEQVRENVEQLHISKGMPEDYVTVSVGVDVRCASGDVSLQGLYGRADKALYQAKQSGRNRVCGLQSLREYRKKTG